MIKTPTQENPFILNSNLQASSEGKAIAKPYDAVLFIRRGVWIVGVRQPFDWGMQLTPGQWALETLLENPNQDGISIDWGQKWQIDSGMVNALTQVIAFLIDYSLQIEPDKPLESIFD